MAEVDCRILAIFALALSLLSLGGVIFVRHHVQHASGILENISAARDCPLCDCSNSNESAVGEDSKPITTTTAVANLIATPCESNRTASTPPRDSGFHISETCLQCICEMSTNGCKPVKCANGDMCGIFRISKPYWTDAGMPTPDSETIEDGFKEAYTYTLCVNNQFCAARAVNSYLDRYKRDCDGNGVIDCYDYAAIHLLGPTGCKQPELFMSTFDRLNRCLEKLTIK